MGDICRSAKKTGDREIVLRLKLHNFLKSHHISETALADAIAEVIDIQTPVSERYLRYLASNTKRLTPDNKNKKPSLVMLGFIIRGLRYLTGEPVNVTDIVEYISEPYEEELLLTKHLEGPPELSKPASENALVPLNYDSHTVLDHIRDLTLQRLKLSRPNLSLVFAAAVEGEPYGGTTSRRRRWFTRRWVRLLTFLLTTLAAVFVYDRVSVQPRLLAARGGVFAFRDRIKATSELSIPTLIGPEGEVGQLEPVLRVSEVTGALAYEFYVENKVSGDGVYTGPLPNSSFPIPAGTLCPNTSYEWRVRALGGDGWTSFSSGLEFEVAPEAQGVQQDLLELARIEERPDTPVIAAPLGSTASTTPTLEVETAPDVMGYGFYIRDLQTDSVIYNNNFALSNTVQVPDDLLEEGGIYQWNTRARNCHYWSEFTPAQVFNVDVQGGN